MRGTVRSPNNGPNNGGSTTLSVTDKSQGTDGDGLEHTPTPTLAYVHKYTQAFRRGWGRFFAQPQKPGTGRNRPLDKSKQATHENGDSYKIQQTPTGKYGWIVYEPRAGPPLCAALDSPSDSVAPARWGRSFGVGRLTWGLTAPTKSPPVRAGFVQLISQPV
jgi:hypothetical protein